MAARKPLRHGGRVWFGKRFPNPWGPASPAARGAMRQPAAFRAIANTRGRAMPAPYNLCVFALLHPQPFDQRLFARGVQGDGRQSRAERRKKRQRDAERQQAEPVGEKPQRAAGQRFDRSPAQKA